MICADELCISLLASLVADVAGVTGGGPVGAGNSGSLLYMSSGAVPSLSSSLSETELQTQLVQLEKQYRLQEQVLSHQFEEQRRMLAHEQHSKMQDYIKVGVTVQHENTYSLLDIGLHLALHIYAT